VTDYQFRVCKRAVGLLSSEGMRGVYDGEQARRFDRAADSIEEALELAISRVEEGE